MTTTQVIQASDLKLGDVLVGSLFNMKVEHVESSGLGLSVTGVRTNGSSPGYTHRAFLFLAEPVTIEVAVAPSIGHLCGICAAPATCTIQAGGTWDGSGPLCERHADSAVRHGATVA